MKGDGWKRYGKEEEGGGGGMSRKAETQNDCMLNSEGREDSE